MIIHCTYTLCNNHHNQIKEHICHHRYIRSPELVHLRTGSVCSLLSISLFPQPQPLTTLVLSVSVKELLYFIAKHIGPYRPHTGPYRICHVRGKFSFLIQSFSPATATCPCCHSWCPRVLLWCRHGTSFMKQQLTVAHTKEEVKTENRDHTDLIM